MPKYVNQFASATVILEMYAQYARRKWRQTSTAYCFIWRVSSQNGLGASFEVFKAWAPSYTKKNNAFPMNLPRSLYIEV